MTDYESLLKTDVLTRILSKKKVLKMSDIQLVERLKTCHPSESLHRNLVNDWKKSKSSSYMMYLDDIAEILGTPVDHLLGRIYSEKTIDSHAPRAYTKPDEALLAELIEAYSQLTDEGRAFVRQAAKVALGQYKKPAAAGGNAPAPSVSAVDGAIERTERSPSPAPEPAGDGAGFDAEEAAFLEMARQQFRAEKENGQKASSVKESGAG